MYVGPPLLTSRDFTKHLSSVNFMMEYCDDDDRVSVLCLEIDVEAG